MIREQRFVMSKHQYALNLDSIDMESFEGGRGGIFWSFHLRAAWFRRTGRGYRGCMGTLRGCLPDFEVYSGGTDRILRAFKDGRHGGDCHAHYDGRLFWQKEPQSWEAICGQFYFLRAMREGTPHIPEGYDGWWRFETAKELRS
jgi:hypothetical protein